MKIHVFQDWLTTAIPANSNSSLVYTVVGNKFWARMDEQIDCCGPSMCGDICTGKTITGSYSSLMNAMRFGDGNGGNGGGYRVLIFSWLLALFSD